MAEGYQIVVEKVKHQNLQQSCGNNYRQTSSLLFINKIVSLFWLFWWTSMFPIWFISQHLWKFPQSKSHVNFLLTHVCVVYCIEIENRSNSQCEFLNPYAHLVSCYANTQCKMLHSKVLSQFVPSLMVKLRSLRLRQYSTWFGLYKL